MTVGTLRISSHRYVSVLRLQEAAHADQPNHRELAIAVHNLAGVWEAQGKLAEAAAGFERALKMKEVAYAEEPYHPDLATTVHDLAVVREAQGRLTEAAEGCVAGS